MCDYISHYTVLGLHDRMDFHPLENAHAERTTKKPPLLSETSVAEEVFIYQYLNPIISL